VGDPVAVRLPAYPPQWAVITALVPRWSPGAFGARPQNAPRSIPSPRWRAMILRDGVFLAMRAITAHRLRSGLTCSASRSASLRSSSDIDRRRNPPLRSGGFSQFGTNIIGVTGTREDGDAAPSGHRPRSSC
jgi:hypothetical protein